MHVFAQGILNFEFSFFSEISTYIPFSQKNISFQNSTLKKKNLKFCPVHNSYKRLKTFLPNSLFYKLSSDSFSI